MEDSETGTCLRFFSLSRSLFLVHWPENISVPFREEMPHLSRHEHIGSFLMTPSSAKTGFWV